ncbi:MAG: sulfotransferase domain-containing protein [Pseudomonadota bacterium]
MDRPRTIEAMQTARDCIATGEGIARGLSFPLQPSDIVIAPYAKCGTTWMQQIVHGLRTGGSMEFDEITAAVPWLELAHDLGIDLDAPQAATPRAFKSHADWDDVPKGGRYIVVFRDPADALVSLYRFFEGWLFEPGSIPLEDFALSEIAEGGWWRHAASWWRERDRTDILFLTYEGMSTDLPGTVARVADFIDPAISPEARNIALEQASFAFMKRHEARFDDHLIRQRRDAACGLPPGGSASKVSTGHAGKGLSLSETVRAALARRWDETMAHEFGHASYPELAAAVDARNLPRSA